MLNSFLQIMFFVFLPLPIALVFRGRSDALLISPLIGLAAAFVAGMLHLLVDVPIAWAWLLLIIFAYLLIFRSSSLRERVLENARMSLVTLDYVVVITGAVFVLGFIWRIPPPLGWDARSIWLFLASLLIENSQVYAQAQQMPGVFHPQYPFGVPASVAVAWQLFGGVENLWSGVRLIAALTLCVSLLTVKTLLTHLVTSISIGYQMIVTLILTPIFFLVYGSFSRNGYMDPLLANLIALASVCMFVLIQNNMLTPDQRKWLLTLSGLSLFCATSVKQEGIWFSLMLLIAYVVVDKKNSIRIKLALSLFPITSFLIWKISMLAVGSTKKGDASGIAANLHEAFEPNSEAWMNHGIILDRYFVDYLFVPTPLLGIFALSVALAIVSNERKANVGLLVFATIVWFGNWFIIFAPYMFGGSRYWIEGWLASSFDRIVTSQLLFTYIFAAYVFVNIKDLNATETTKKKESSLTEINA
jgi:hypothetical protein